MVSYLLGLDFNFNFLFIKDLFEIVVTVAVQNTFCLKIYQNNIYFIFKKLFLISAHQNDLKTHKNKFSKKIFSKFEGTRFAPRSQTLSKSFLSPSCQNISI